MMLVECDFPAGLLRFSTQNYQDTEGNWPNNIISISNLSRAIGQKKSFEVSSVDIQFKDIDRFWRNMMSGQNRKISKRKVTLLSESKEVLYTGVVERYEYHENIFQITVSDQLTSLNQTVISTISKSIFPGCIDEAVGQPIQYIYSTISGNKGGVKCFRVDINKYLLAGHHCTSLAAAFDAEGNTLAGTLNNAQDGFSYVNCTSEAPYIQVNCTGKTITNPINALLDLISGLSVTYNIDSFSYVQQIIAERNYKFAAVIQDALLKDIIENFCNSFDLEYFINRFGEIALSIFLPNQVTPELSLTDRDLYQFQISEDPSLIQNKRKYMYNYNFAGEYYQFLPVFANTESVEFWGECYPVGEPLPLQYTNDFSTAFDVIQRVILQSTTPPRTARFSCSSKHRLELASIIQISTKNALDFNPRQYQIKRISFDSVHKTQEIEARDLTTLNAQIYILGDETQLPATFEQATEAQKIYGFLADETTKKFSNGEPAKVMY